MHGWRVTVPLRRPQYLAPVQQALWRQPLADVNAGTRLTKWSRFRGGARAQRNGQQSIPNSRPMKVGIEVSIHGRSTSPGNLTAKVIFIPQALSLALVVF